MIDLLIQLLFMELLLCARNYSECNTAVNTTERYQLLWRLHFSKRDNKQENLEIIEKFSDTDKCHEMKQNDRVGTGQFGGGSEWPFRQSSQGGLFEEVSLNYLLADKKVKIHVKRKSQVQRTFRQKQKIGGFQAEKGGQVSAGWCWAMVRGEGGEISRGMGPCGKWKAFAFPLSVVGRSHLDFFSREWPNFIPISKPVPWLLWGE